MSDWVGQGLTNSARVMLGEGRAANGFDGSRAGVQSSFLGLALALFMDAGIMSSAIAETGRFQAFAWLLLLGGVSYVASIATLLVLTREPQHRANFPRYLAGQNWAEAGLAAAFLVPKWIYVSMEPVRVEGAEVSGSPLLVIIIVMGVVVASFVAHYRLLLHGLGVSGVRAFWMVVAAIAASFVATAVLN